MSDGEYVGYGKPPKSTRFRKGMSGNPKGRPRGRLKEPPHETVLGQMVTIREDGVERRVPAEEAFLLHMTKQGLNSGGATARHVVEVLQAVRETREAERNAGGPDVIVVTAVATGSVSNALEPLRIARKLDRYSETARMMLEPWIVERALERLRDRRLTIDEQRIVLAATRTPKKVRWPDWWEAHPKAD